MNPFFLGMNAHQIAELLMPFSSLVSQYQVSGRTTFTVKKVCQNVTDFVRCHVFPRVCLENHEFWNCLFAWKKILCFVIVCNSSTLMMSSSIFRKGSGWIKVQLKVNESTDIAWEDFILGLKRTEEQMGKQTLLLLRSNGKIRRAKWPYKHHFLSRWITCCVLLQCGLPKSSTIS